MSACDIYSLKKLPWSTVASWFNCSLLAYSVFNEPARCDLFYLYIYIYFIILTLYSTQTEQDGACTRTHTHPPFPPWSARPRVKLRNKVRRARPTWCLALRSRHKCNRASTPFKKSGPLFPCVTIKYDRPPYRLNVKQAREQIERLNDSTRVERARVSIIYTTKIK